MKKNKFEFQMKKINKIRKKIFISYEFYLIFAELLLAIRYRIRNRAKLTKLVRAIVTRNPFNFIESGVFHVRHFLKA